MQFGQKASSLSFPCHVYIFLQGIWSKLGNLGFYAFSVFKNLATGSL